MPDCPAEVTVTNCLDQTKRCTVLVSSTAGGTNLTPGLERAPLWPQEDILEVQLDVILNARHAGNKAYWEKEREKN